MDIRKVNRILDDYFLITDRKDSLISFYDEEDFDKLKNLFVGQKIKKAEKMEINDNFDDEKIIAGQITLSNDVEVIVKPNEGCGGCSNGWYFLENINVIDHIITDVDLVFKEKNERDGEYSEEKKYNAEEAVNQDIDNYSKIYMLKIYSDGVFVGDAIEVVGSDGNGYYGTGFELIIVDQNKDKTNNEDKFNHKRL